MAPQATGVPNNLVSEDSGDTLSFDPESSSSGTSKSSGRLSSAVCVPEFVYQLMRMLQNDANWEVIQWGKACILVHDPSRLERDILQNYFRHSNFTSFQRQLNYFGFRKLAGREKMSPCSFISDDVTDDLSSLLLLKRKGSGQCASKRGQINDLNRQPYPLPRRNKSRSGSYSSSSLDSIVSASIKKEGATFPEHAVKSLSSQVLASDSFNLEFSSATTSPSNSDAVFLTAVRSSEEQRQGGGRIHSDGSTTNYATEAYNGELVETVMIHACSSLVDLAFVPPPPS